MTLILEAIVDTPTGIERVLQMAAIKQRHQIKLFTGYGLGHVIESVPRQVLESTLLHHEQ